MRSVWFGLAWVVACSSGGSGHSPAVPAEGGSSSGGTRARPSTAGSQSTTDAGSPGQAGDPNAAGFGGAGEGGEAPLETAGAPPEAPPGICDPTMMLGKNQTADVGVPSITLLSMTADELSVAFTTGSGVDLLLHVADRSSTQAEFIDAGLTVPDGFEAASGVTLSADGRKLVLVMSDHSGFGELTRDARGDAFVGDADLTAFAAINSQKPMSGYSVGWPVLSADDKTLYFLSYFSQGLVVQSERGKNGVFDLGTEIDPYTLGGNKGEYKLLTGLSSDQRAIFFFDQATQHAGALFRSAPGAPFYDPLDLGARQGVAPNDGCNRLYSSVAGSLVVQARQ